MWDPKRGVGVLNDFDLAKFAGQKGASGTENTGTLPFMALDLLSPDGLAGKIPRLYRHEAESFAWSLIYLCISTIRDEKGKEYVITSDPLRNWFRDWSTCHGAKLGFAWDRYDQPNFVFAYPNAKILAEPLHEYWIDRYRRQFKKSKRVVGHSVLEQKLGFAAPAATETPAYTEEGDDTVFQNIVVIQEEALRELGELKETMSALIEMANEYAVIDWSD